MFAFLENGICQEMPSGTYFLTVGRQRWSTFLTPCSRRLFADGRRQEYVFLTVFLVFPTVNGRQECLRLG